MQDFLNTMCTSFHFFEWWNILFAGSLMVVKELNLNSLPWLSCAHLFQCCVLTNPLEIYYLTHTHKISVCMYIWKVIIYHSPCSTRPRHTAETHWLFGQSRVFLGLSISIFYYGKTRYKLLFVILYLLVQSIKQLSPAALASNSRITHSSPIVPVTGTAKHHPDKNTTLMRSHIPYAEL